MSYVINIGDTPTVPTKRYRFIAIVFFLLALVGLFLGFLVAHSNVVVNPFAGYSLSLNGVEKATLSGTLFGYILQTLTYYFTIPGALSADGSVTELILNALSLAQALLLAVAFVLSFLLALVACMVRGRHTRNCAMLSAYLVTTAFLWTFLSVMFWGAGSDPSLPLLGFTFSIDMPTLIVVGASLVLLAIITIGRRTFTRINKSMVGVVTVLIAALLGVALIGFIYQESYTFVNTALLVMDALEGFVKYLFIALVALFAFNILLAIWRQNAKRFYLFDAIRYGLLFLAVLVMFIYFMIKPADLAPENADAFLLFKDKSLWYSLMLLLGTLLAFLLSMLNVHLVAKRRRKNMLVEEENTPDEIDENPVAPVAYTEGAYEVTQTVMPGQMPTINVTVQAPPAPSVTVNMPAAAATVSADPSNPVIVNTPAAPAQMPMPMPIPIPMPMPMYAPQMPASAPAPAPMPMAPFMMPGLQQPPMPMFGGMMGNNMMGGCQQGNTPPVIISAPQTQSAPPVIVLQPNAPTAATPAAEPASAPAPEPAPAESGEYELSDFEKRMLALADKQLEVVEEPEEEVPAPVAEEPEEEFESVYYGPYDEFFTPLSDKLKKEFNELFVVKSRGEFGLPTYKVGGNNSAFFTKVFTRLGNFRSYISDELMSKIYDYTK